MDQGPEIRMIRIPRLENREISAQKMDGLIWEMRERHRGAFYFFESS